MIGVLILVITLYTYGNSLKTGIYSQGVRFRSLDKVDGRVRSYDTILRDISDISDKLVFEEGSGRLFEQDMDERLEDQFVLIDKETGKTILLTKKEKERIFLDAVQSFYFDGKSTITDDEFSALREDLAWEGSMLVTLSRDETKFLNAMASYMKGQPTLNDVEFDALKASLKETGSIVAVDTEPKCYVDTGVCKTTWLPDRVRTGTLYIPASFILSLGYIGFIYEVPGVRNFNPLFLLALGSPLIFGITKRVTEGFLFKEPLVASGPCPACQVENYVFFGDVLGVEGDDSESTVKCTNCKTALTVKRNSLRVSTLMPKSATPAAKVKAASS